MDGAAVVGADEWVAVGGAVTGFLGAEDRGTTPGRERQRNERNEGRNERNERKACECSRSTPLQHVPPARVAASL